MIKSFDLVNVKPLNVGNAYTYTLTADDKAAYSGFIVTVADTITVSNGTQSVALTLAANDEVALNNTFTTIVGTATNNVLFVY